MAKAELEWLAGSPDKTAASLHTALQIYEDLHVVALVELASTTLAGLTADSDRERV
jgi:hypothetical protein